MNIQDAKNLYVESAKKHGQAMARSDPKSANQAVTQLRQALAVLRSSGAGGEALVSLLDSANSSVRGWAARDLLLTHPDRAQAVLERLAKEPGEVGLDAEITLQEWRAGRLVP